MSYGELYSLPPVPERIVSPVAGVPNPSPFTDPNPVDHAPWLPPIVMPLALVVNVMS
jgi:hypothetical protein